MGILRETLSTDRLTLRRPQLSDAATIFERYGQDKRFWDFGTSPVLTKKAVVMTHMHAGESWLAAFDKNTGEVRWKEFASSLYPDKK